MTVAECAAWADVVMVLTPDEGQAALCERVVTVLEGNDGVTLLGSRNATMEDFEHVMAAIRSGAVPVERQVPWNYVGVNPARGEFRRPVLVVPQVSVAVTPGEMVCSWALQPILMLVWSQPE